MQLILVSLLVGHGAQCSAADVTEAVLSTNCSARRRNTYAQSGNVCTHSCADALAGRSCALLNVTGRVRSSRWRVYSIEQQAC